ncbi:MAG: SIS domain-containing protein [Rhodobacteraceae bacterium]|nr:SIS domain-containing protein [Paracoccaceae bacterium]
MPNDHTLMRKEISDIPAAVEHLLSEGAKHTRTLAEAVREKNPRFLISVARGSSDHACTYLKYASELVLGLPMASVGPSVHSIYGASLQAEDALCLSVSQSGQSPDIVSMTRSLRISGALTVAITNNPAARLIKTAEATLPLYAGPENSVAATKTFVNSIIAGLLLIAEIKGDAGLRAAISALPSHLHAASRCDWSAAAAAIQDRSVLTLGRGPSWAISNEAALKFKETCLIHAESYSSAEVLHGPVSIIDRGFPVIVFAARDMAEQSVAETADKLSNMGAGVFVTSDLVTSAQTLPHVSTGHPLTDPIAAAVSFYEMVERLSRNRGIDPDRPRHLRKVTETV